MPTYTHNNYYGYINKIQEKAISNPKWFWSDAQDASEARQWLYNNNASSIVENIYNNTPEEIKSTINSKYLPTNIQQNNFNSGITSATTSAAKNIGKAALTTASIGMTGAGLIPVFTEGWTAAMPFVTGWIGGGLGSGIGGLYGAIRGESKAGRDYNNTPKDETRLQNGISSITGYNKAIPYKDRSRQYRLDGWKKGSILGGIIGGIYGSHRGIKFENLMNNNFDWDKISSNLVKYHKELGTTVDPSRLKSMSFTLDYPIKDIPSLLSKTKIRLANISGNGQGQYFPGNNLIEINKNPWNILFSDIKGTIAHEGEHAVQDIVKPFSETVRRDRFDFLMGKEISEQPVGKLFEKSLGKKNPIGSWERSPAEFDSEMALARQLTKQPVPYSKMSNFSKWLTRNYMKYMFRLNNEGFNTAVRAQEQALKNPWQNIK